MSDTSRPTTFVTCIEAGPLSQQVVLLARSLRALGTATAKFDMLAIQPRRDLPLPRALRRTLGQLGVEVVSENLVGEFDWYSNINKSAAMSWAEANVKTPFLTWLDGDMAFVRDPVGLIPGPGVSFMARAAAVSLGTDGQDKNAPYWDHVSQLVGVPYKDAALIDSLPPAKKIFEYYQAGVYTLRIGEGISERHFAFFKKVLNARVASQSVGTYHYDQLCLALAVRGARGARVLYPWEMNYNLNHRNIGEVDPEMLARCYVLHYHDSLLPGNYPATSPFLAHLPEAPRQLIESVAPMHLSMSAIPRLIRRIRTGRRKARLQAHAAACQIF